MDSAWMTVTKTHLIHIYQYLVLPTSFKLL
jgi:hypothetical protein